MNKAPRVSVLMPAYNAEKYIAEAIESILNQTFQDFEFIIVDDGSRDDTWNIIKKFAILDSRIVPIRNEVNLRISATLNKGILISRGEYIARMDSDDWSYPKRLETQIAFMDKNPNVVICGGVMELCDSGLKCINTRTYALFNKEIRNRIFRYSPFCHAATMYRLNAIRKAGGYNSELSDAEDYDMYFRLGHFGEFANLNFKE